MSGPSLSARLQTIGGHVNPPPAIITAAFKELLRDFNSLIHGDPKSALSSAVLLDGEPVYTVTKDVTSPARTAEICRYASAFAMVLTVRCADVFPHGG